MININCIDNGLSIHTDEQYPSETVAPRLRKIHIIMFMQFFEDEDLEESNSVMTVIFWRQILIRLLFESLIGHWYPVKEDISKDQTNVRDPGGAGPEEYFVSHSRLFFVL